MASPNFDSLNIQHSRNIEDAVAAAATDGQAFTAAQRSAHLNAGIRKWMEDQVLVENYNGLSSYTIESPAVSLSSNVISLTSASFTGGSIFAILSVKNVTNPALVKRIPFWMKHMVDNSFVNSFMNTGGTSSNSVVMDISYTIGANGVTITDFSGVLPSHVGCLFVGYDSAANGFVRTISGYLTNSSFTVSEAIAGTGESDVGFIVVQPTVVTQQYWTVGGGNLNVIGSGASDVIRVLYVKRHTDLSVAGSSDIEIPQTYWSMILDYALIEALKEKPQTEGISSRLKITAELLNQQLQRMASNKIIKNG